MIMTDKNMNVIITNKYINIKTQFDNTQQLITPHS